jgi:DNA-binding response OmpR family regulator
MICYRVKQALELGAGAYIKKPYALKEIAAAVRNELDRPAKVTTQA